ncbi:hypothetical protein P8452_59224 [Trifolium repens]|nr:hypothetical protein P8452_59224 [Trifolium repens]
MELEFERRHNFLYPSAIDQFRKHFAYLEENKGYLFSYNSSKPAIDHIPFRWPPVWIVIDWELSKRGLNHEQFESCCTENK